MKPSELLFLGCLVAFAGGTLYSGLDMPYASAQGFGPGFVPVNMAAAILVFCAAILIRGLARRRAAKPGHDAGPDGETGGSVLSSGVPAVLVAIVAIALATLAASLGSLLIPLGICLFVVTTLLLGRGWRVGLISTVVTLSTLYGIFSLWLKIPLS